MTLISFRIVAECHATFFLILTDSTSEGTEGCDVADVLMKVDEERVEKASLVSLLSHFLVSRIG